METTKIGIVLSGDFSGKETNFDTVSTAEVAEVEVWLANYMRKILGWKTPQMLFE